MLAILRALTGAAAEGAAEPAWYSEIEWDGMDLLDAGSGYNEKVSASATMDEQLSQWLDEEVLQQ